MKRYKGYFIDGTLFRCEKDVDNFLRKRAIERYSVLCTKFYKEPSVELANFLTEQAERLHNEYGLDWNEIEALEA